MSNHLHWRKRLRIYRSIYTLCPGPEMTPTWPQPAALRTFSRVRNLSSQHPMFSLYDNLFLYSIWPTISFRTTGTKQIDRLWRRFYLLDLTKKRIFGLKFWIESRLIRSSQMQKCRSFSERSTNYLELSYVRSYNITNKQCTSSNYENTGKKILGLPT